MTIMGCSEEIQDARLSYDPTAQWMVIKRRTKYDMKREIKQKFRRKTNEFFDTTVYKRIRFQTKQNLSLK